MTVDRGFINILKSCNSSTPLRYLMEAKVLTSDEEQICSQLKSDLGFLGKNNLFNILRNHKVDVNEYDEIATYTNLELLYKIDLFISERRKEANKVAINTALEEYVSTNFKSKTTDLFLKRFASEIEVKNNFDFSDLEYPEYLHPTFEISSGIKSIDQLITGLQNATITTIIGTNDNYKSMLALNIAYQAILNKKNVLYISLGENSLEIAKRFLCRHSKDSNRFNKPISIEEINTKYDKNVYTNVYNDFENNLINNLVLFDMKEFDVSTHYNLQRLIVYAEKEFNERFDKGIDLIVIDDFVNMKLDTMRRTISYGSQVVNEYYKYLKEQSKGLLGTRREIPIVITANSKDESNIMLSEGCDYRIEYIMEDIRCLSDTIISVYGDRHMKKANCLKIKVLKSNSKVMEESLTIKADYDYWYIQYEEIDALEKSLGKDTLIQYLEKDNTNKEQEIIKYSNMYLDAISPKQEKEELIDDKFDEISKFLEF